MTDMRFLELLNSRTCSSLYVLQKEDTDDMMAFDNQQKDTPVTTCEDGKSIDTLGPPCKACHKCQLRVPPTICHYEWEGGSG